MSIVNETKINSEKQLADSHQYYDEFEQQQIIIEIKQGESLVLVKKDSAGNRTDLKECPAKYINCHANMQWQDKGIKKEI